MGGTAKVGRRTLQRGDTYGRRRRAGDLQAEKTVGNRGQSLNRVSKRKVVCRAVRGKVIVVTEEQRERNAQGQEWWAQRRIDSCFDSGRCTESDRA